MFKKKKEKEDNSPIGQCHRIFKQGVKFNNSKIVGSKLPTQIVTSSYNFIEYDRHVVMGDNSDQTVDEIVITLDNDKGSWTIWRDGVFADIIT